MKRSIVILFISIGLNLKSQNLFPVRLDNCKTDRFCLDCGDIKAGYDENDFLSLQESLNKSFNLQGMTGTVKFQVLVGAKGRACVLSHTDQSNNPITLKIISELNNFKNWTAASSNGKTEEKSSINLVFTIQDNKLSGNIERVDMANFKKSFDRPKNPEIFNQTYQYKNENLKNYNIIVWNAGNSNLPNNMSDHISIDKNGLIWLTIDEGLVTFDGKAFKNAEQNVTEKGNHFGYYALTTDNNNVKWVFGKKNIYSFNDTNWVRYDSSEIGINGASEIINNPKTGEVFFCAPEGLTIYKNGKWSTYNKNIIKELPSSRIRFAKRDSKNRIWVGTFSGSAMIDEEGKVLNFQSTNSVLKGKCISSMDEDENGTLYFSLYEFDRKEKGKVNNNEGIAIRYPDGSIKQFTSDNSGMPFNHATYVLYDKFEKVLWISTDRAGLVRYDLKEGWENYHNQNSNLPTSYISSMNFDEMGNLYLATRQGLVKIEKKQK